MKKHNLCQKYCLNRNAHSSYAVLLAILLIILPISIIFGGNCRAGDWPNKPITVIVPWPNGAGTDLIPRILAVKMSKMLGVPINVVNKPGGAGIIGTLEAVKSPPDGYTVFADCGGTSSIQYGWGKNLPYKVEERTYIARLTSNPQCVIVPASSPWTSVEDLVISIQSNPSSISYAMIGGTGVPDVNTVQFLSALTAKGIDVSRTRAVSYKGTGEVLPAVAGGHISFSFAGPGMSMPLISAGKIRGLAVTSAERFKDWPVVPTTAEVGFPSVNTVFWVGLSGPPGMPDRIVRILDDTLRECINDPDIVGQLDRIGVLPFYLPQGEYRKFVIDSGEEIKALKLR